jgi:Tfp pilus assembly protein PilN
MSFTSVNLASRPFSNQTPVLRTALALGVVALLLVALNATLYWSYLSGSGEEARAELARLDGDISRTESRLRELDREVAGFDREAMSLQVEFLNLRIAERTFTWSRLFEDLGEVLPATVRLERLSPRLSRETRGGAPTGVLLAIEGAARNDEAVLAFIDALFAHPRFENPDPSREARREGELRFSLTVTYKPPVEEPVAEAAAERDSS